MKLIALAVLLLSSEVVFSVSQFKVNIKEAVQNLKELIGDVEKIGLIYGVDELQLPQFGETDIHHPLNLNQIYEFIKNDRNKNKFLASERSKIYNAIMKIIYALDEVLEDDPKFFQPMDIHYLYYLLDHSLTSDITKSTSLKETLSKLAISPYYIGSGSALRVHTHITIGARIREGHFDDPRMQYQHVFMARSTGKVAYFPVLSYLSKNAALFAESVDIEINFSHLVNAVQTTANLDLMDKEDRQLLSTSLVKFFMANYQFEYFVRAFLEMLTQKGEIQALDLDAVFSSPDILSLSQYNAKKFMFLNRVKENVWKVPMEEMNRDGIDWKVIDFTDESLLPMHILDFSLTFEDRKKLAKFIETVYLRKNRYAFFTNVDTETLKRLGTFLAELKNQHSKYSHLSEIIRDLYIEETKIILSTAGGDMEKFPLSLFSQVKSELEYHLLMQLYVDNDEAYIDFDDDIPSNDNLPIVIPFPANFNEQLTEPPDNEVEKEVENDGRELYDFDDDGDDQSDDNDIYAKYLDSLNDHDEDESSSNCQIDRTSQSNREEL